jgi:uncharacterized sporulation protein YeaH/YhbH (DUF444 family)
VAMPIVDRRLNPGSKSLENRQRFLRRAKALVQGAVKKSSEDRDIKDVLEGGEVSILRCTNLLPKPSGSVCATTGGPPRSIHI